MGEQKLVQQVTQNNGDLITRSSIADDPAEAIAEIAEAIGDVSLAGGLLFCSNRYDRDALSRAIVEQLPKIPLVGCPSAGELTGRGYDNDSLVFIGFPADDFVLSTIRFDDLDHFDNTTAQSAIRQLVADSRRRFPADVEVNQVAIFLVDGLSHREELLTICAQEALGKIQMIGGSSGDDLAFRETFVLHEGTFHRDAAVIAIISSTRPLHVFCANHYRPGPSKMVITEANPTTRTVYEINAAPAAEEYLRLSGSPPSALDAHFFAAHPPMVKIGGQYHVRSVQTANPDGSLNFYCAIDTGVVLTIGEPVDRIAGMRELFANIEKRVGTIDHIVGFDCVLNRIDAENRQIQHEVSALYTEHRVFGFNTYGEQFMGAHVNQTFSGLAVGRR